MSPNFTRLNPLLSYTALEQQKNSQESQQTGHDNEISIYKEEIIDQFTFAYGMKDLKSAFPKLSADWYDYLKKRIIEKVLL